MSPSGFSFPNLKLDSKKLRVKSPGPQELAQIKRQPLYFIVDNVLDTYNIGGLFRLADAVACSKVYLCGATQTPPSSRIHKAAVGTQSWVPWEYAATASCAIDKIKTEVPACRVIALEQHPKAIPLHQLQPRLPTALIVGHETTGVSKSALEKADTIVEIPLFGINKSLNAVVATALVAYRMILPPPSF